MRLLLPSLLLLIACGPKLGAAVAPDTAASAETARAMADMMRLQQAMQSAQQRATSDCAPWLTREVPPDEQRWLGRQLAVAKVTPLGPIALDGTPSLAEARAQPRPLKLGPGPANTLTAWVVDIGQSVARFSARPKGPWTFGVIDSPQATSLSFPGGYVFVTTGLLKRLTTDAQLAGVLAHEVGHVDLGHAVTRYQKTLQQQCVAAVTARALLEAHVAGAQADVAQFADQFVPNPRDLMSGDERFTNFILRSTLSLQSDSKQDELDADAAGLRTLAFAGYDLAEYQRVLPVVQAPAAAERVTALEALRQGELAAFQGGMKTDITARVGALP